MVRCEGTYVNINAPPPLKCHIFRKTLQQTFTELRFATEAEVDNPIGVQNIMTISLRLLKLFYLWCVVKGLKYP